MKIRNFTFVIILTSLAFVVTLPASAASGFCQIGSQSNIALPCPLYGSSGPAGSTTFGNIIIIILNVALLVVGSIAVLFLIIGGFRYVTAHGNEEQAEAAKKTITSAIIGLVVVVLSFAIVTIIVNVLVTGVP